ncbi:MAG TPA: hypothetical protein PKC24_05460 [Cyclobacteriaceae bacterium]|nr:hypothetical protein [Cyclobacteriaceae bacterium]
MSTLEQKIKFRFIAFISLLMVTVAVYFLLPDHSISKIDKNLFKPEAIEKIDKVVIQRGEEQLVLQYINGRWMLNDNMVADRQMIQVLFASIDQALPKRKAAASQQDSLLRQFNTDASRVELYEENVLRKAYLVLGDDNNRISWFKDPNKSDIYQIIIPGYSAYVAFIYKQPLHEWKDRLVFDFNWRNFASLSMEYSGNESAGFEVSLQDDYFAISQLPATDTTALNDFLDHVSMLEASKWVVNSEFAYSDSLVQTTATAKISIADIANRSRQLELWYPAMPNNFVLARLNQADMLWLERRDAIELLKRRTDFLPGKRAENSR